MYIAYDLNQPLNRIVFSFVGKDYGEARPVDIYANHHVKRDHDFSEKEPVCKEDQFSNRRLLIETKVMGLLPVHRAVANRPSSEKQPKI